MYHYPEAVFSCRQEIIHLGLGNFDASSKRVHIPSYGQGDDDCGNIYAATIAYDEIQSFLAPATPVRAVSLGPAQSSSRLLLPSSSIWPFQL